MGRTSKDKRDIYYRKAKQQGYRARSAFKLLQLDDKFGLLRGATRVVDLCAAPGGWSQVIAERVPPDSTIIAVDLMEMAPLDGVVQLQGDITHKVTADEIVAQFRGQKAQVVVSDGAPDVLGLHDLDEYLQAQLVLAGLNISLQILEDGGTFVAKLFRGKEVSLLYAQLRRFFGKVTCAKPKTSRNSSFESFVVCQDFHLPEGFVPDMERNLLDLRYSEEAEDEDAEDWYTSRVSAERGVCVDVVFMGAGDVFGYDADQSYPLDEGEAGNGEQGDAAKYVHQEPLQKPINPPYANALKKQQCKQ
ncbi:ribosomal RNA large subunit methyltransferase J [Phytophthora cinnamomi]|uniref:ribosomal RNA large subunit methyltransferase J n=1 Tax=Phytophthora cinnamomi TaxID=4785 RepID=UPI0035597C6A|nr:ribosomal RNA large subunit methyltransferase J [Phytophthora cinnamomi]